MARLAPQSLGQLTWLAQAMYTIQVDNTPLLFILGSTRLKFSQGSSPLDEPKTPLALPPPIQEIGHLTHVIDWRRPNSVIDSCACACVILLLGRPPLHLDHLDLLPFPDGALQVVTLTFSRCF